MVTWARIAVFALSFGLASVGPALAHEDQHTHPALTRAIFELLEDYWDQKNLNPSLRPTADDVEDAAEGSIVEDACPNYYSHLYNPNSPTIRGSNVAPDSGLDPFCDFTSNPNEVTEDVLFFVQSMANVRAGELWTCALQTYRGQSCTEPTLERTHSPGRETAFNLLGQVLHLLEDMTSPAHVHADPHGKPGIQGFGDCVGFDADDFENWGWCLQRSGTVPDADHGHIRDYVDVLGTGLMMDPLRNNLATLFGSNPQGTPGSLDPVTGGSGNIAKRFVEHVARLVYNFTAFKVELSDTTGFADVQPESELRRMLRGSTNDENGRNCGVGTIDTGLCDITEGFTISGAWQEVGFSDGFCGRSEGSVDTNEEWWPMEDGQMGDCSRSTANNDIHLEGFAYIENTGGEGVAGLGTPDSFIPLKYGCPAGNTSWCGGEHRSKRLYSRLFGNNDNPDGRTMLRIYGDILYPVAVAYGAGLVETFVEEVNKPTADAGPFYTGEACQVITLDGSGSTDQGAGTIVSYAWDFTDDGVFDRTVTTPTTEYAYPQPFSGEVRLRVTDNDGFTDDGKTEAEITPDTTPPNLSTLSATPNVLWPSNHKMVDVVLNANASDACGVGTCRIVSVTSNDPGRTVGRGQSEPDVEITGDLTLRLRAEKNPEGASRVYRATVECTDVNGNAANNTVDIVVPHSNSSESR